MITADMKLAGAGAGIGCFLVSFYVGLIGLAVWLGSALFQYSIWAMFHKDLPWFVDAVGGLVCSAVLIPVSFACWVAQMIGYATPFIR